MTSIRVSKGREVCKETKKDFLNKRRKLKHAIYHIQDVIELQNEINRSGCRFNEAMRVKVRLLCC